MQATGESITICVPTHNRADRISFCLDGIAQQDGIENVPVVVVNNNCTDNTDEVVLSYKDRIPLLRVVHETGVGNSHARNRGLAETTTPYIAYLDDDTRPSPNWSQAILATFESTREDCIAAPIRAHWVGRNPWWIPQPLHFNHFDLGDSDFAADHIRVYGPNMAFRVASLREAGGFDPALGMAVKDGKRVHHRVGEEADICQRMLAKWMKIAYSAGALALHANSPEMARLSYIRHRFVEGGVAAAQNALDSFAPATQAQYYSRCVFKAMWLALTLRPVQALAPYMESVTSATAVKTYLELNGSRCGWRRYLLGSLIRNWREFYRVARKRGG